MRKPTTGVLWRGRSPISGVWWLYMKVTSSEWLGVDDSAPFVYLTVMGYRDFLRKGNTLLVFCGDVGGMGLEILSLEAT